MEPPPAKCMRIMQSIGVDEVDETHPDYIEGKKQNSQWLKNKFGSIFAKYEAMSDMMSDEWDMREGKVVVDRGHARRWDMEYRKRLGRRDVQDESQLVDDLFVNDPDMEGGDEESDGDARDELAPSQSPEPVVRRPVASTNAGADNGQEVTLPAREQVDIPVPETPVNTLQNTLAVSANPAADLVQLVQFPQTPAGQQARQAFELQTAQAVQQAVASILSSLLPNTPSLQPQQPSLPQSLATPDLNPVHVAPAALPDLRSMPPPAAPATEPAAIQSSPITTSHTVRRKRRSLAAGVLVKSRRLASANKVVPFVPEDDTEAVANESEAPIESPTAELAAGGGDKVPSSTVDTQRKSRQRKYVFTADDDKYIIESRLLHRRKWKDIAKSRAHWKNWPLTSFLKYWRHVLVKEAVKMGFSQTEIEASRHRIAPAANQKSLPEKAEQHSGSPLAARHLPTPSSLEQEEAESPAELPAPDNIEDTIASGGHFDDDERELLSIYGDIDSQDLQPQPPVGPDEDLTDASQEIPETPLQLTQEDSIQQILQGTFTRDNTADLPAPSVEFQKIQSPSAKPTAGASTHTPVATTNHTISTPPTTKSVHTTKSKTKTTPRPKPRAQVVISPRHTCPLCLQTFPSRSTLTIHTAQPHPREVTYRPASPPPATQFDPLAVHDPATPQIKREPRSSPGGFDCDFVPDSDPLTGNDIASSSHLPQSTPTIAPVRTPVKKAQGGASGITTEPRTSSSARSHALHSTPAHAHAHSQSSAIKPASAKMSRAEYRAVRASWARGKGTPVGKKRGRERGSGVFGEVGGLGIGKRWRGEEGEEEGEGDGQSEDELGV